jgi:N-acetyl-anhydromuramyl-L-alanine amidase AmpD
MTAAAETEQRDRILPHVVKRGTVACHSSRHGGRPVLIVVHDTEGANIPHSARDLLGLYAFFDQLPTQASAHAGADNDGQSIQMVPDHLKAWHVEFYNPVSLGIEMVHKQGEPYTDALYRETARWVAWWSREHGIPIRRGAVTRDGRVTTSGVVMHRDLGQLGGGHHDPIPPWNQAKLLTLARHYRKLQQAHHHI